ncbi:MAG: 50S ribosomal protein L15e [Nanoarchaeota archaeon]|nr:50S ribosomal protein L15e [Nanoarchaeota archaeon]MBU1501505.1 50S ribosomal protein L15e [Nanoarchaeota archaeon]MBU2459041.1 50S ribosomal protein L15e [Nanoarchaeota archaeon]
MDKKIEKKSKVKKAVGISSSLSKKAPAKESKPETKKSVKGLYHYIREAWKKPDAKTLRERMIDWRASPVLVKVEKPLRIDRARSLGYKAKKGFVIVRVRLNRGGHKRPRPNKGRRGKRLHTRKNLRMNYQEIAEQRAARKFTNLEVLNSYQIGKDGIHYFFEVILVDPERPEIKNDSSMSWIGKPGNKGRVFRGLTSAGKKSRGLRNKSKQLKVRPSLRAHNRRGK